MTFMLQLKPRERERLLRALGSVIAEPFRKPDAYTKDGSGRTHFVAYRDRFKIKYWLDSFPRELRVVEIEHLTTNR